MILNIEERKLRLIQDIMNIDTEYALKKVEEEIKHINNNLDKEQRIHEAIKPITKSISIDKMVKEQNYKPLTKEAFYKKTARLKIEEPLEELLEMLRK